MRPTSRPGPAVALVELAAARTGCEYFRDTPSLELANRRWRDCAADLHDVKLEREDTDGRIRFTYVALNERDRVIECLEAAAGAGGASLETRKNSSRAPVTLSLSLADIDADGEGIRAAIGEAHEASSIVSA